MLETQEDIDQYLEELGDVLTFSGYTLYGFPGVEVSFLTRGEDAVYGTEVQEFSFQTSTKACKDNSVAVGNTFTYTDGLYTYTFKVLESPISDLTGWSRLKTSFVSKSSV
jgi:hypothetical protein